MISNQELDKVLIRYSGRCSQYDGDTQSELIKQFSFKASMSDKEDLVKVYHSDDCNTCETVIN